MSHQLLTVEQLTPAQCDVLRRFLPGGSVGCFDPIVLAELRDGGALRDDDGVDELTPHGRTLLWQLLNAVRLPPIEP